MLTLGSMLGAAEPRVDCPGAAEKGQTLRDEKKLREARKMFVQCAAQQCPRAVRHDCTTLFLPQLDAALPTVVVRATDAQGNDLTQVRVSVDGEVAAERLEGASFAVDPGPRSFRFEGAGAVVERKITVVEGEKNRVITVEMKRAEAPPATAALPTAAASSGPPTEVSPAPSPTIAPWVLLGVGAVSLGVFGGFQVWARSQRSDLEGGCGQTRTCSDDDLGSVRTKFVISGVGLGVGVAALAAGGGWLLWRGGSATSVKAQPTAGGGVLQLGQVF